MLSIYFFVAFLSPCLGQFILAPHLSRQSIFNTPFTFLASTQLPQESQRSISTLTLNPDTSPYSIASSTLTISNGRDIFRQQPIAYQTNQVPQFTVPQLLPSDPETSSPSPVVTETPLPSTSTTTGPELPKQMVTCETKNITDSICSFANSLTCDGETLRALIEIYRATEDEDTNPENSDTERPELLNLLLLLSTKNDGFSINIDALCAITTAIAEQACAFSNSLFC